MKQKLTRRELIQRAATTAAAFSIVPRHVLGGPGYIPPSEQLVRGVIGVGGMGKGHLHYASGKLVAVCDVDRFHVKEALEIAKSKGENDVKPYEDFRELLARPDIDLVHIATPPHWHGVMNMMAANAGKDIWGEKPFSRTIAEGQKAAETINRNGRIFRMNTRFRFESDIPDVGIRANPLKRLITAGVLGWPLRFNVSSYNGFPWKLSMWAGRTDLVPQPVPEHLNYDMWLGPAPVKPYHPHRVHMSFRGYWDYDGGGLGDQGQHFLDPIQYLLGKDDTSPVEVEAEGPTQHPDAAGPWHRVWMRYADGCEIVLLGDSSEERDPPFIEGPKGKVYQNFRSTIPNIEKIAASLPDVEPMETDFMKCVKTRRKFVLNEFVSHRSCTLINLAKIAVRTRRLMHFDPETFRFVGDDEANRLVEEPMRAPWHV